SGPPLQGDETDLPEARVPRLGEGADLPRRQPAGFDLQRRGSGQPPASQDAEDGVPGPNSSDDPRPDRPGHVRRDRRSAPCGNDEGTPPHQAAISPDNGAKVSKLDTVARKPGNRITPPGPYAGSWSCRLGPRLDSPAVGPAPTGPRSPSASALGRPSSASSGTAGGRAPRRWTSHPGAARPGTPAPSP